MSIADGRDGATSMSFFVFLGRQLFCLGDVTLAVATGGVVAALWLCDTSDAGGVGIRGAAGGIGDLSEAFE